jgi:hypothetical protein
MAMLGMLQQELIRNSLQWIKIMLLKTLPQQVSLLAVLMPSAGQATVTTRMDRFLMALHVLTSDQSYQQRHGASIPMESTL